MDEDRCVSQALLAPFLEHWAFYEEDLALICLLTLAETAATRGNDRLELFFCEMTIAAARQGIDPEKTANFITSFRERLQEYRR